MSARLPPSMVADAAERLVKVEKELNTLPPPEVCLCVGRWVGG